MAFTPPMQFPGSPKLTDEEVKELKSPGAENPHVLKYVEKYRKPETEDQVETLAQRMESMKKVLLHIQAKKPFNSLTFEEKRILKECYDSKYFEGLVISEMISGRITVEYRHEPRLTYDGMRFLNSLDPLSGGGKERSSNQDNERPDRIKQGLNLFKRFIAKTWGAFVALGAIITVVQGREVIVSFLKWIASFLF